MAVLKELPKIKTERPDTIQRLEEIMEDVKNDELELLLTISLSKIKGEGSDIVLGGYWADRISLIGALEYLKMSLMDG